MLSCRPSAERAFTIACRTFKLAQSKLDQGVISSKTKFARKPSEQLLFWRRQQFEGPCIQFVSIQRVNRTLVVFRKIASCNANKAVPMVTTDQILLDDSRVGTRRLAFETCPHRSFATHRILRHCLFKTDIAGCDREDPPPGPIASGS